GELTAALGQVRDFVGVQLVADLQAMQHELSERSAALQHGMAEDQALIDKKYAEWDGHLVTVEELVDKAFGDARQHVEHVVLFPMTECVNAHPAAVDALKGVLADMVHAADALTVTVGAHQAEVDAARQTMESGMIEASQLLTDMIPSLNEVKELMASY